MDHAHHPATVRDPVCGMSVVPGEAKGGSHEHAGTTYWFCNPRCHEKFASNPPLYLKKPEEKEAADGSSMPVEPAAPPGAKTEWVCPMHPEIVRSEPGTCPICGMALERRTVSVDEDENPELIDMSRRFWFATSLT